MIGSRPRQRPSKSVRSPGPFLHVDFRSTRPLYLQLCDGVVAAIGGGALQPGTPLPSLRRLSEELGVNFHTVHRAYDVLRQDGFLFVDRRQRFIVQTPPSSTEWTQRSWDAAQRRLLTEGLARGIGGPELTRRIRNLLRELTSPTPGGGGVAK
ncbi:MAG: GntR family transcriptional regulator [Thermoplasmata archaeon]|nr:GntR family transcriptional regulator [Thermoplasmata archaeon]